MEGPMRCRLILEEPPESNVRRLQRSLDRPHPVHIPTDEELDHPANGISSKREVNACPLPPGLAKIAIPVRITHTCKMSHD